MITTTMVMTRTIMIITTNTTMIMTMDIIMNIVGCGK
jgi:hypothetical protein